MADRGLKHVVHRRTHLERPQPKARKNHGLLEKKKDYVQRARNFHMKEDAIKKMHRQASFKNQDEFAFSMVNHNIINGKMRKKDHNHLTQDEVKLADSQDARYIGMREQADKKAIEKKLSRLHFMDTERINKHTVFLDEDELDACTGSAKGTASVSSSAPAHGLDVGVKSAKLKDVDVAAYFDTHPALLNKGNRLRKSQLQKGKFQNNSQLSSETKMAYRDLVHVQERAKKLGRVREELDLRQALRKKGVRKKVASKDKDRPAVYKWHTERKK